MNLWPKYLLMFLLGLLVVSCEVPVSKSDIAGTYVNRNYLSDRCCLEAPHIPDTLVLKNDGTYTSGFYGSGTYQIDAGLLSTEITWYYEDQFGGGAYSTTVLKDLKGSKYRIVLNYDLNHYYEKIK